jgi:phosphoribosylaminoimidazole (AIR) synthetase
MGIGMALIVAEKDASAVLKKTRGTIIGGIARGTGQVRILL